MSVISSSEVSHLSTTNSSTNRPKYSFLDLASELRLKVYRNLFSFGEGGISILEIWTSGSAYIRTEATAQFLRSCSTVANEGLHVFYGENRFVVLNLNLLQKLVDCIGENSKLIRGIELYVSFIRPVRSWSVISPKFANLTSITVSIGLMPAMAFSTPVDDGMATDPLRRQGHGQMADFIGREFLTSVRYRQPIPEIRLSTMVWNDYVG